MIISLNGITLQTTELQTMLFLKEEGFKSNVNSRQGVSLPYLGRDMTAECSANTPLDRMEIVHSCSLTKTVLICN